MKKRPVVHRGVHLVTEHKLKDSSKQVTTIFYPTDDRIVIEPLPEKAYHEETHLIQIPENSREQPQQGYIVAVGPGRYNERGQFIKQRYEVGQLILHAKYGGSAIELGKKVYLIVRQEEVLGVIDIYEEEVVKENPVGADGLSPYPDIIEAVIEEGEAIAFESEPSSPLDTLSEDEIARACYNRYGSATDYKNFIGDPMPPWVVLPSQIQEGWKRSARRAQELVMEPFLTEGDQIL